MESGKYSRSNCVVVQRRAVLAALCLAMTVPATASGQSAGTLNAFGFFGTWAVQCGAQPSPGNVVQTVTWTGREPVEFSATVAPGTAGNRYRVVTAQMPNATTLVMQIQLNGRSIENLTITKYGTNRIRTMTNQTSQGLLVRDGVVVATGRPTPWLQKCS
jgi:hypothetical protein